MAMAGYFGHGLVAGAVVLLLFIYGCAVNDPRIKRAALALLIAVIVAGLAAQVLKEVVQWPRPKNRASQGFPSGHTSAAFALASVLTATFPAFGPIFYLLAVLTALSRLYFRAHFTWDVLGGVVVGHLAGIPSARLLVMPSLPLHPSIKRMTGWAVVLAFGIAGLAWFHLTERNIFAHMVVPAQARSSPAVTLFDFGSPQARNSLHYGWSGDERWLDGKQSVVWATGLGSELSMSLPEPQDYRFRLHVLPYSPKGPACQTVELRLNGVNVAKLFLEQGWHYYEIDVPKIATTSGSNRLQFFYSYAESPRSRKRAADLRALSVAFDKLEVIPAR